MHVDIARQLGAVSRTIAFRDKDGTEHKVLTASRRYPTNPDDLWNALTTAERIPRWFMPVSGDLKLGGRYQLQGNAGGIIERCEPPRLLALTWEFAGDVSWVVVTLRPDGDGTLLTLEHSAVVSPERWAQYGAGATGIGWELGLLGMDMHIADPKANPPEESMPWLGSENYRDLVKAIAADWSRASIAAGDSEQAARAAEKRCVAFYTGQPED